MDSKDMPPPLTPTRWSRAVTTKGCQWRTPEALPDHHRLQLRPGRRQRATSPRKPRSTTRHRDAAGPRSQPLTTHRAQSSKLGPRESVAPARWCVSTAREN